MIVSKCTAFLDGASSCVDNRNNHISSPTVVDTQQSWVSERSMLSTQSIQKLHQTKRTNRRESTHSDVHHVCFKQSFISTQANLRSRTSVSSSPTMQWLMRMHLSTGLLLHQLDMDKRNPLEESTQSIIGTDCSSSVDRKYTGEQLSPLMTERLNEVVNNQVDISIDRVFLAQKSATKSFA